MPPTVTQENLAALVEEHRKRIDEALANVVPKEEPRSLYEPAAYILEGQGKRLRPLIVLLAAEAFGRDPDEVLEAAIAFEVFHNFTLVHDDIMDHADTRRGRETLHKKWDEGVAILSGDYLMGLSYDLLTRVSSEQPAEILRVYHQMVRLLCEGQAYDTAFESRTDVTVADYLHMIDRKTGALIEAAFVIGGLLGNADASALESLRQVGHGMGRAFQIQDDLLDLIAQDTRWGKKIGGDLIEGKKAFLLLKALERAEGDDLAWFQRIVDEGAMDPALVDDARARMDRIGVLATAADEVERYSALALEGLAQLPAGPPTSALGWLIEKMQRRHH